MLQHPFDEHYDVLKLFVRNPSFAEEACMHLTDSRQHSHAVVEATAIPSLGKVAYAVSFCAATFGILLAAMFPKHDPGCCFAKHAPPAPDVDFRCNS
jgi:hypothetical protein